MKYEVISICCGQERLHLATDSLAEVCKVYDLQMGGLRIKVNGEVLRIHLADRLCEQAVKRARKKRRHAVAQ